MDLVASKKRGVRADIPVVPGHWLRQLALGIATGATRANPIVAIASSVPREGTTTIVVNLARVLNEDLRRRVVVVDACLGTPVLHDHYGVPCAPGLAEVLRGGTALREAVQLAERGNFAVLPAGAADPWEQGLLLSGARLPGVLDQLRREAFDVCLIDCPATLAAPETAILARHADTTYCVVRAERTSWDATEKATVALRGAGCNLGGVILNRTLPHIPRFLRSAVGWP
jgi:Mrp family chromosome partitioning ATPase